MRVVQLVAVATLFGCGNPQKTAESCGLQECPVGTLFYESREVVEGIDIAAAYDPATYSGELAFSRVGEGRCEYYCQTMEPCDEGTFPVITEDCFTCGVVNQESGDVSQGVCAPEDTGG